MRFAPLPKNPADILALESVPLEQRLTANTTYEIIKNAAQKFPDKAAIHFLQHGNAEENPITISYRDLLTRVNQAANLFSNQFATLGITDPDKKVVSYLLGNLPQAHFALWGAQAVGIVNPLSPRLSPEQIAMLLRKAKSEILVTVGEFVPGPMWQNVLAARELYPELKTILVIGGRPDPARGIYDFDGELDQQSSEFTQAPTSPDAVCAYFHTSATTTPDPKLVRLTQRGQIYSAWAIGAGLGYQENDVVGVGLPFFHVGAPMVGGLVPFMCGATTVMMSPMGWMGPGVIENFWKVVQKHKITVTAALASMYRDLLLVPGMENSGLRLAISGTPMPRDEFDIYQKAGITVADIYGSSETVMATMNFPGWQRSGSMGWRFPYEQMKVMRTDGTECAANEMGELWIAGPNVTNGYQGHSQSAFTHDGWFKTGDLVTQSEDGCFSFVERTADMIHNKAGAISSLAIEKLFEKHSKIARCAVIGQPDSLQGEVPVIYLTVKPDCDLTIPELRHWINENIFPQSHRPVEIFIEDSLPLNGIAKIIKPLLRERLTIKSEEPVMRLGM